MESLSENKRRVLELMTLGGLSSSKAAREVKLRPDTVRRWIRTDAVFRNAVETWRSAPPIDHTTVAQTRRVIVDEFARRVLNDRKQMSLRELMNVYDRLTRGSVSSKEEGHDERSDRSGEVQLTTEQAERIWAERERRARAEAGATDDATQS